MFVQVKDYFAVLLSGGQKNPLLNQRRKKKNTQEKITANIKSLISLRLPLLLSNEFLIDHKCAFGIVI